MIACRAEQIFTVCSSVFMAFFFTTSPSSSSFPPCSCPHVFLLSSFISSSSSSSSPCEITSQSRVVTTRQTTPKCLPALVIRLALSLSPSACLPVHLHLSVAHRSTIPWFPYVRQLPDRVGLMFSTKLTQTHVVLGIPNLGRFSKMETEEEQRAQMKAHDGLI